MIAITDPESGPTTKPPFTSNMKTSFLRFAFAVVLWITHLKCAVAADLTAEFTGSNEGWTTASHARENPPWPLAGITATDPAPAVADGFLRVQDLNGDWQVAGVTNQVQVTTDLQKWKNYGLPFPGDGTKQSRWVRVGDQQAQYFRIVRTP